MWRAIAALLIALVGVSTATAPRRMHACVSKFETEAALRTMRWDAITDLGQAINTIVIDGSGGVAVQHVIGHETWPMQSLIDAAHGNKTRISCTIHPKSKPDAARFLALEPSAIRRAVTKAVGMGLNAGYDGVQLDWEGLAPQSSAGFLSFLEASSEEVKSIGGGKATLSVTVYAPKLVFNDYGPYNMSAMAKLADHIFVMGYDMRPTVIPMGDGWRQAGPQSPLDALAVAIEHAVAAGAPHAAMILGLPFYGKVYICNGTTTPIWGNCSCGAKLRIDRSVDILSAVAANASLGCIVGYDVVSATPFVDCPHGTGVRGIPSQNVGTRQQAWYENERSLGAKVQLAVERQLAGVAVWSTDGVSLPTNAQGRGIWDIFARYVANKE